MKHYTATATREGRYWHIKVAGIAGGTQALNLTEAREMAISLVNIQTGIEEDQIDVHVQPTLGNEIDAEVKAARIAVLNASLAQQDAAEQSRKAARDLVAAGLKGRDVAIVMEISPGRVSQLLKATSA